MKSKIQVILAEVIEAFDDFLRGQRVDAFRDGVEWVVCDDFGTSPSRLTAERARAVLRSLRDSDGRPVESLTTASQMRMSAYFHGRDVRNSR